MTIRFTIHTRGPEHGSAPGWMHVVVHDTVEDLRAAAAAYDRRRAAPTNTSHEDTEACFQQSGFVVTYDDETGYVREPAGRYAGVMRLPREVSTGTIAHECVHAATAMFYRQHASALTVMSPMPDEEVLAYTVGDLVHRVVDRLYDVGVFGRGTPTD